jgi:hypothetical protein
MEFQMAVAPELGRLHVVREVSTSQGANRPELLRAVMRRSSGPGIAA